MAHAGNIGFILAQKEFDFSLNFRHSMCAKAIGTSVTMGAGFILRDYRALVLGIGTGYLVGLALSYVMHPYRPRWNTSRIPEIWAVTKWLMLAGVGGFVLRKGDELIAARIGSTRDYGLYNVGADLGQLPTSELGPTILKAFLPVLSSIQDDVARTNQAVIKTVSAVNTIILPVGAGFAAVAPQAVQIILGPSWVAATAYVFSFAIAGAIQNICNPLNTLLVLRGFTRVQSLIVWLEFSVFVVAALALVPGYFLLGLVGARILGSVVNICATGIAAQKLCGVSAYALTSVICRPLAGSIFMYGLVIQAISHFSGAPIQLAVGVATGGVFFSIWCMMTWHLVRRPEGLESTVFDQYKAFRNRASHR
jgi:O-antigen/teichoic acid export membrane protein